MKKEPVSDITPQEKTTHGLVAKDLYLDPIQASDVIHFVNGKVFMGVGELVELSDNELWNIATEIEYVQKMRWWNIVQQTLRNQAYLKVFSAVGNPNEVELGRGGKWMLFCLDEIVATNQLLLKAAKDRQIPRGVGKKPPVV